MANKPYVFNGTEYHDLNSLALAYIEDFDAGMDDIFVNAKKLVKFVKKYKRDKEFVKQIVSILYSSKYKNNALSFIIFEFLNDKKVIINGKELTFDEYIIALKENPNTEDNALFAFLEDNGLSKTYAKLNPDSKLLKESYSIERNCYLPFTYSYLTTYSDFEIVESLNGKVSSIAINGEECFRRGSKLTKNETFQLGIAHKVGFKLAVDMNKDINPIFKAIKLLKQMNESEDEYLRKLISDTFYWWLIDNLDKYLIVNKQAKQVFLNLLELKKKYKKFEDLILAKEIYSISIDLYADLSRDLYLNYLEFVKLFREGKIIVKKKFEEYKYKYTFDKPYCMTYICQDFMDGRVVKLYSDNPVEVKDEPQVKINPLTGEVIEDEYEETDVNTEEVAENDTDDIDSIVDDISDDAPIEVLDNTKNINKKLIKLEKKMYKNRRFGGIAIFLSVVSMFVIILGSVFAMFKDEEEIFGNIGKNMSAIVSNVSLVVIAAFCIVLLMVLGGVLRFKASKTIERINDALYLNNARASENMSVKQQKKLESLATQEAFIQKTAFRSHRILTCILGVFASLLFSVLGVYIAGFIGAAAPDLYNFEEQIKTSTVLVLSLLAGPIISLILGIFKKYKGMLSMLLIFVLSIIVVFVIFMVL